MKCLLVLLLLHLIDVLSANPISVRAGDRFPLSAESTHVLLGKKSATVEGSFRFVIPSFNMGRSDSYVIDVTIPVVAPAGWSGAEIRKVFQPHIRAKITLFDDQPTVEERPADERLPSGLSVYWVTWHCDSSKDADFELALTYQQPLFDGKFYYIPWTMERDENPQPADLPGDARLQITIQPMPGFRVNLQSPQQADLVGLRSVTLFARHRNLIVAGQSKVGDTEAP